VRKLREKKPVVASMGATAASGGYYVACAADSIMALEGTITGSIGVVATFLRTEELYHKIGLDVTVIKSGKYKDVGSPYRKMSEEEKQYMGALLDRVYNQFVDAVCEGRHLPREEVMGLAEGRIYSGEEAAENGLIDRIGSFDDAVQMATDMGNIHGKARIVKRRKRPDFLERLLGERVAGLARGSTDQRMALKYIIP
jgi:protease-4